MKLGPHEIVVVRAASKPADYGTGTDLDWGNVTRTTIAGCSVQPQPSSEFTLDRDVVITHLLVYAPHTADIDARDRVEWLGDLYDIDGDILRWEFGALSHLLFNIRKSEG